MNYVCLMGRLTSEPELKRTQTGKDVLSFTLAVDRGYGDKKATDFLSCVAWEHTARFVNQYFRKGSLIAVEGSIQTRSYEDKNGNKRTATEIVVSQTHFTGEKASKPSADIERYDKFMPPPPAKSFAPPPQTAMDDFQEVSEDDDDLPF